MPFVKAQKNGLQHHCRMQDLWIACQAIQYGFSLLTLNK